MRLRRIDLGSTGDSPVDLGGLAEMNFRSDSSATTIHRCIRRCVISTAFAAVAFNAVGQEKSGVNDSPVTVHPVPNADLAYDLMHFEVVAEGSLPLPGNVKYRILSVQEQGNCVGGCPPARIYVLVGDVSETRDGEAVTIYRIDGARFIHYTKAEAVDPKENGGFFLNLRFTSMPQPAVPQHYTARVGSQGAIVQRDGVDIPPPTHRFVQLFQRPDAGVFRMKFKDEKEFRLKDFEIFDPKIFGQADAWSAEVVECAPTNPPLYRMAAGMHYGPFLESEIAEIFDEGRNETVYPHRDK